MDKYRIGVIGAGARGEYFAKTLYQGTPRAVLAGICDIDPDRLQKFCDYCGLDGAATFSDPDEFFARDDMDAVIITTPEFTHREVTLKAIAASKHFYLEKAMAQNSADCRAIIKAHRESNVTAYLGFNMRAQVRYERMKEILDSGVLGQIVHIEGIEILAQAHGAAFMRRFHRQSARSGGLLNTKCAHDLDILQWFIGHQHRVVKVASFGGVNVFTHDKQPAEHCCDCPREIRIDCAYQDRAGFVFPVTGKDPIHKTEELSLYGGDLCVYNDDKDLIDNQTVIIEWDNGVRGNFNLQLFQNRGRRETRVWGEKGYLIGPTDSGGIRVVLSDTGEVIEYQVRGRPGGHGGADPEMLGRFLDLIEGRGPSDSGLAEGLAATLLAEKADEARLSGSVVEISPDEYM